MRGRASCGTKKINARKKTHTKARVEPIGGTFIRNIDTLFSNKNKMHVSTRDKHALIPNRQRWVPDKQGVQAERHGHSSNNPQ
jgi:hypothetical protein